MRTVSLTVDTNGAVTPNTISGGHEGEHNVTSLDFTLASELLSAISFFRLSMGDYVSEELYPENNKITYPLPQCVMFANNLLIQLEGYKENDVGEIELVFKSDIVTADIKPSIVASHEIPEELNPSIDTAVAKLSYYVENSDQLSKHIDGALQETKEVIEQANESFEIKSNEYMREMNDMLIDGRRILNETAATLQSKADYATTLKGYGIKDAYTKSETDIMLLEKANINGVYTKAEIDNALTSGMQELLKNEEGVFEEYIYFDPLTFTTTHYWYFEYPEPLTPNAKYKLKIDNYFDYSEIRNLCVCVGDIHHPVLQGIDMYYENETYTFIETVEFSLPDVIKDTDKIFFRFDCIDAPGMREVPYTLFASKLLPCYNKNQVDELINNKADKPKKVIFNDMGTLNLADNTIYEAEGELLNPYFNYPEGDFMCSITFTLANMEDFDVTVTLPQSKYIGGVPTFAKGETWELNIKNGVVVGGLIE